MKKILKTFIVSAALIFSAGAFGVPANNVKSVSPVKSPMFNNKPGDLYVQGSVTAEGGGYSPFLNTKTKEKYSAYHLSYDVNLSAKIYRFIPYFEGEHVNLNDIAVGYDPTGAHTQYCNFTADWFKFGLKYILFQTTRFKLMPEVAWVSEKAKKDFHFTSNTDDINISDLDGNINVNYLEIGLGGQYKISNWLLLDADAKIAPYKAHVTDVDARLLFRAYDNATIDLFIVPGIRYYMEATTSEVRMTYNNNHHISGTLGVIVRLK